MILCELTFEYQKLHSASSQDILIKKTTYVCSTIYLHSKDEKCEKQIRAATNVALVIVLDYSRSELQGDTR